jgi:hypothetical protein
MSIKGHKIINTIRKIHTNFLSASEKHLLTQLALYGDQIFPSLATIERVTSLSERQICRLIKVLKEKKVVDVISGKGTRSSNQYKINIETLYLESLRTEDYVILKKRKSKISVISRNKKPVKLLGPVDKVVLKLVDK